MLNLTLKIKIFKEDQQSDCLTTSWVTCSLLVIGGNLFVVHCNWCNWKRTFLCIGVVDNFLTENFFDDGLVRKLGIIDY